MRICIVTPAPPKSRHGNRVTALRWSKFLRQLGHQVVIQQSFAGDETSDLLLALHAKRSAASIERFRRLRPESPLLVALTGTDLYRDIHRFATAQRSLELADRLILLQPHGKHQLTQLQRKKAVVIYQSTTAPKRPPKPLERVFEVVVVGHLRPVKDPFRAAIASRGLPESSRIKVVHLGASMEPAMQQRAESETAANPRYQWLGEQPRYKTLRRIARARLLVLSSKLEGGANVVSEAIAAGTPVLSSRVSGSIGLLGDDYPGFFDVGDTLGLRGLMSRAELDAGYYHELKSEIEALQTLVDPANERASWEMLLEELRKN